MTVGEKIKTARKAAGLTQDKLAELSHISQHSIAMYEVKPGIKIRTGNLVRLADALNVTYDYLADDEETDPQKGAETAHFIDQAREAYGDTGAKQLSALLNRPDLSFSESLSKEDRDSFYQAVTDAFLFGKIESAKGKAQKKQR